MTDRHRSNDKTRDSDRVLGETGAPASGGRSGGRLARDIGTRDEEKRAYERPAGATRATKSDEDEGADNA